MVSGENSAASEIAIPDSSTGVDRQQITPPTPTSYTPSQQQPQQQANNPQAAIQEMMMKALQLQVINNNNNNNSSVSGSSLAGSATQQLQKEDKVTAAIPTEILTSAENEVRL